jgi:hypothetical protein
VTSNSSLVHKGGLDTDSDFVQKNDVKNIKLYINNKLVDVVSSYSTDTTHCTNPKDGYLCGEFSYYDDLKGSNKFVVKIDTSSMIMPG